MREGPRSRLRAALPRRSLRPWAGLTASPVRGDVLVTRPQPAPSPSPGQQQLRPRPQAIRAVLASPLARGRHPPPCVGASHQFAQQPRRRVQARLPSQPAPSNPNPLLTWGPRACSVYGGLSPLGHHWVSCCGPNHRPLTREVSSRGPTWGAGWGRLTEALRPGLWSCRDLPAPGCAFPSGRSPRGPSWRAGGALGDEKGQAPGTGLGQPGVLGPH